MRDKRPQAMETEKDRDNMKARRRKPEGLGKDVLSEDPNVGVRAPVRSAEGKYTSRALRLDNNLIREMSGLMDTLSGLFMEPTRLAWLNLSFNMISSIPLVLTELVELRVLYLHANSLCRISEVDKLGALPFLHTVTLHGNGIESMQGYRSYVISTLPHLKMMDFSAITKQERLMASVWGRSVRRPRRSTNLSTQD